MRIAVYSDIHANLPAYEAVLDDISRQGIDASYNLGDIVGYGPFPKECVDVAASTGHKTLRGNHDKAAIDHVDWLQRKTVACKTLSYMFTDNARRSVQWAAAQLQGSDAFLRTLPFKHFLPGIQFMHASPVSYRDLPFFDDEGHETGDSTSTLTGDWHYVMDAIDATIAFQALPPATIAFFGHSHVPFAQPETYTIPGSLMTSGSRGPRELIRGKRALINVGSVGQPRDRIPEACYCIYDAEKHDVVFRSVPYDISRTREAFWKLDTYWAAQGAERIKYGA